MARAQKEAILHENPPFLVTDFDKAKNSAQRAVCRVKRGGNAEATAFLCHFDIPGQNARLYGIATCHHVLNGDDIRDENLSQFTLEFEGSPNKFSTQLSPQLLGPVRLTDADLDGTFLQLKIDIATRWANEHQLQFLPAGQPHLKDQVLVLQHPGGGQLAIHQRVIEVVTSDGRLVYHSASTQPGSSGSPLVNLNGLVVGVHRAALRLPSEISIALNIEVLKMAIQNGPQISQAPHTANQTAGPENVLITKFCYLNFIFVLVMCL